MPSGRRICSVWTTVREITEGSGGPLARSSSIAAAAARSCGLGVGEVAPVEVADPLVLRAFGAVVGDGQPHQPARPLRQHAVADEQEMPEQRLRRPMTLARRRAKATAPRRACPSRGRPPRRDTCGRDCTARPDRRRSRRRTGTARAPARGRDGRRSWGCRSGCRRRRRRRRSTPRRGCAGPAHPRHSPRTSWLK